MIEILISSKTRIKLLLKFFLNSNTTAYLRGLESDFGESSNSIRLELNRLEKAGMLIAKMKGNKKIFQANKQHPLFNEIHSILRKHIGLDYIVENVVKRLGNVQKVYLVGKFAQGLDSQIIDLMFIGDIDTTYLVQLIEKVETLIKRKVRYIIYKETELPKVDWAAFKPQPILLWAKDEIKQH